MKAAERDVLSRLDSANDELERARAHFEQAVANQDVQDEALTSAVLPTSEVSAPTYADEHDPVEVSAESVASADVVDVLDDDVVDAADEAGDLGAAAGDAPSEVHVADAKETLDGWEDAPSDTETEWGASDDAADS